MRLRWFLLGLLVGLALAAANGRTAWRMARDRLASAIDVALRLGLDASCPPPRTYNLQGSFPAPALALIEL